MVHFLRPHLSRWARRFIVAIAACILPTSYELSAQRLAIHGTVSDPSGAAIADAQVEVLEHGIAVATVATDALGQYRVSRKIVAGSQLRVSVRGFSAVDKAINTTSDGSDLTLDVVLQVAPLSEQVTVTSTGAPTPQAQLGAAVTVLDPSDYRATRDIQEGLRYVPGLQATQTGQAGGTTSIFIRGGASDANKVLIDGVPMNDIGGAVGFANVASAAVGQVEVLRGPNSALYGSDALAGVISLTTTRGTTPLPLISYRADGGNFGTYEQEGAIGGRLRAFDYFSNYSRFDSGNAIPDDEYHNGTFAGNYGWNISPASSLRATIHHDRVAAGQPGAVLLYGVPTDGDQTSEDAYFGATWEDKTTANWHNLVQYGGLRLRSLYSQFAPAGTADSGFTLGELLTIQGANGYSVKGQALEFNDGPPYPYTYSSSTDRDFVYAQSDYRLNPHVLGLLAFRYEDERGYSGATTSSIERGNYSYTFQIQGDIKNRLFYTLGSGLEDNGLFGLAGTPRASLAWQVAQGSAGRVFSGTKLRASFGEGIKEPAIFDQLDSLYAVLSGLPQDSRPSGSQLIAQYHITPIGPQNSRTYDGGIDQLLFNGRGRVSLTPFHNEFTNGIDYIPQQGLIKLGVPSAVAAQAAYGATVNSQAYRAEGAEAEIEVQLSRGIFLRGGYTYVDARIQHSFSSDAIGPSFNPSFPTVPIGIYSPLIGARPFRIAPHTGYFQSGYSNSRLAASVRGTLVGSRDDSDFLTDANYGNTLLLPNRNLDGAYQRIDLVSSYQASRCIAVEANFQNLLNEHYSEAFGYPSLPFTFRAGIKLSLGGESWKLK